jgi:hypothetical protein
MSVLIDDPSGICEGMTHIRVRLDCNKPLVLPKSLKRLRILGKYDYPLQLPEGLKTLELGWDYNYQNTITLPKGVTYLRVDTGQTCCISLPSGVECVFTKSEYWIIPDNDGDLVFVNNCETLHHMYAHVMGPIYKKTLSERGKYIVSVAKQAALAIYRCCIEKKHGKDVAKLLSRAVLSDTVGWYRTPLPSVPAKRVRMEEESLFTHAREAGGELE